MIEWLKVCNWCTTLNDQILSQSISFEMNASEYYMGWG